VSLPHYFICILPFLWWSTIVIANVFWSLYGCIRFVLVRIPRWWLTQCCSRWNKSRCKRRGLPASSLCPPRKNLLLENADSLLCYCSLLQAKLLSLADISRACKYQVWPANPLPRRFNVDATMTSRLGGRVTLPLQALTQPSLDAQLFVSYAINPRLARRDQCRAYPWSHEPSLIPHVSVSSSSLQVLLGLAGFTASPVGILRLARLS
jgi:hypothetical protein